MEDCPDWDSLLERVASSRSNHSPPEIRLEDLITLDRVLIEPGGIGSEYSLQDQNHLYEIGCKVGHEEVAVFKAMMQATHPSFPEVLALSVIGRQSIPGRIYVEVGSFENALKLSETVTELTPTMVRKISAEKAIETLSYQSSQSNQQRWTKVRGKTPWSQYRGDIALVFTNTESRPIVLLIPRTESERKLAPHNSESILVPCNNCTFSEEGFLMVDLASIEVIRSDKIYPTTHELDVFRNFSLINPHFVAETYKALVRSLLSHGDRVRVIAGDYAGLVARVEDIFEDEVTVYLELQDVTVRISLYDVRVAFQTGDEVRVIGGPSEGLIGWVTEIFENQLRIVCPEEKSEVIVDLKNVEFYTPPLLASQLRPRKRNKVTVGGQNPNDVYLGKDVLIVGSNMYKGYRGRIIETTPSGYYAFVELEACQHKVEKFGLHTLVIQRRGVYTTSPFEQPPSRPGTPLPEFVPPLDLTPPADFMPPEIIIAQPHAWDPLSRGPIVDFQVVENKSTFDQIEPDWLTKGNFRNIRFKLLSRSKTILSMMEFIGLAEGKAHVRLESDMVAIDPAALVPLYPTEKGELVTPWRGEMSGQIFRVRHIEGDMCIAHSVPTRRLNKNEQHPSFPVTDLAVVYPPFR